MYFKFHWHSIHENDTSCSSRTIPRPRKETVEISCQVTVAWCNKSMSNHIALETRPRFQRCSKWFRVKTIWHVLLINLSKNLLCRMTTKMMIRRSTRQAWKFLLFCNRPIHTLSKMHKKVQFEFTESYCETQHKELGLSADHWKKSQLCKLLNLLYVLVIAFMKVDVIY